MLHYVHELVVNVCWEGSVKLVYMSFLSENEANESGETEPKQWSAGNKTVLKALKYYVELEKNKKNDHNLSFHPLVT